MGKQSKRNKLSKKERLLAIINKLEELYPTAECALNYEGEGWKLLVMGRLSAQCTDARVNIVCKDLFEKYPTLKDMAEADITELEQAVKPCGLYRTKAKNIKDSCTMLLNEYNGILPDTIDELLKFPGVGRKIANLLIGDIYKKPAIVTDTHCMRLSKRMGFCPEKEKNPEKIEHILEKIVPPEKQSDFCHRLVFFGRDWCTARSPRCKDCCLGELCPKYTGE